MICEENTDGESFDFFENIVNYIEKAKIAENTTSYFNADEKCNSFMESSGSDFKDHETAKRICVQFIKLYDSLTDLNCNFNSDPKNEKCRKFLNYWVNFKLRESMQNGDDSVCGVYDAIESQFTGSSDYYIQMGLIDNINKDVLHKMNILYRLYNIYTDLDTIVDNATPRDKESLLSLSTSCCTDYLEANYMCTAGNDKNNHSQFCIQLEKFETKYKGLYDRVEKKGSEYSKNFKRLSQCDNNTMSKALIGTTVGLVPLLVGLYKFTPLRQLINSNKGKLAQAYRNNDDKLTNIMLMDQQNEQTTSQQERYNIKYHSA
uniref:Vir30 protein n=1 Tax=Plasmodium vivax TaxID=5855 RepID=Q9N881_PLAVI|nr:vir30 [Plasmodium vivax]